MDDLIRRQDAIDAIKEFKHGAAEWKGEQEEHSDIWHRADSAIASAIEIGLRVKKIPSAQQWIPCSERLPHDERKAYWICLDTGGQGECRWTNNRYGLGESDTWGWSAMDIPMYTKVIAWMPLPKPYKGECNG